MKSVCTRLSGLRGYLEEWISKSDDKAWIHQIKYLKEIEYLLLRDIVDTVESYKISLSLILNLDQLPLKHFPVGNETI